ncbi:MAG: flagellar basal-body MS-ring/collar protein FliF [Pseudomonadota bacterium]
MQRLLQLPARQLLGLLVAVAAVIALSVGAWIWGQTPDYKVLYSNLSDRDGGAIVQSLNQMNVPYKFTDGGGALMVPSNLLYDTRLKLASQGLPRGSTSGFEIMEQQKLGTTQFQEQINYQRSLEGELAKSIQSLASVQGARVHLAIPKPTVFLREQQKPSASVLVNLYPGKTLDRAQVSGILHLVSSSLPELSAKNVSIVDQNGNLLTNQNDAAGLDPSKLAYTQEVEKSYIERINRIVEPITGANNLRTQVTADIDFNQSEQTAETYKPNGTPANAAMRSQQSAESTNSAGGTAPSGVPGAQSNQPNAQGASAAPGSANNSAAQKQNTVNYELDKTVHLTRQSVGALKRLSAAVVVNNRRVVDAKGKPTYIPLEKAQLDQINTLVKEAMGFSETRGDTLNVVNAPFSEPENEVIPAVPLWKQPDNIALAKEVGKNILIIAFVLYLVLGVLKPLLKTLLSAAPAAAPQLTAQETLASINSSANSNHSNNLQLAKQLAQQDPKIVANVVKSWVSE